MTISIIAAIGQNRELGRGNKLLWKIPEDMKHFRELTKGHAVIMGKKTYESIGKPLPNRLNIVLTHDELFKVKGIEVYRSIEETLTELKQSIEDRKVNEEVFVIGGGQIYKEFLPLADKLYLTLVEGKFDADTFFPDYSEFKKVVSSQTGESNSYQYTFLELERA